VPKDFFSGKEFIYKIQDKGYILYSIGLNLRDDGGKTEKDAKDADDIVVRAEK
jgi:hypothetical protein